MIHGETIRIKKRKSLQVKKKLHQKSHLFMNGEEKLIGDKIALLRVKKKPPLLNFFLKKILSSFLSFIVYQHEKHHHPQI